MNATALTRQYDKLTPAERFALLVSANARGDEAEAERLANVAGWVSFRQRDFVPFSEAFRDLAHGVFVELLDLAGAFADARHDLEMHDLESGLLAGDEDAEAPEDEADEPDEPGDAHGAEDDEGERPLAQRCLDLFLAQGFLLKTKAAGWKLFCERQHVPPFALWPYMPGFERLQRAMEHAGRAAFTPAGMVRFLKDIRPADVPEATEADLISPAKLADDLDTMFNWLVERHGG